MKFHICRRPLPSMRRLQLFAVFQFCHLPVPYTCHFPSPAVRRASSFARSPSVQLLNVDMVLKARSHCPYGCKEDVKRKKYCHPLENDMHPLCTHCIRVSYALSIEHPSTVISSAQKVLSCTKVIERMNFPPFTM